MTLIEIEVFMIPEPVRVCVLIAHVQLQQAAPQVTPQQAAPQVVQQQNMANVINALGNLEI